MGCYYSIDTTYFNKKFSHRKTSISKPIPTKSYLEAFEK